jgi:hypothetical protein
VGLKVAVRLYAHEVSALKEQSVPQAVRKGIRFQFFSWSALAYTFDVPSKYSVSTYPLDGWALAVSKSGAIKQLFVTQSR